MHTFDFEKEYTNKVMQYFFKEYAAGRTPNPDVMCNKEIKFGSFLKKALAMGADYVATGHYAQKEKNILKQSKDKEKDQTYFLWTLTQDQLSKILFPIGHLNKAEVRALARKFKLPTSDKKDSQGLCFIGKIDMRDFLKMFIKEKKGDVVNVEGRKIGRHEGAFFYTIGQRHGFTITAKTTDDKPFFVVAKDVIKNTLTVSHTKKEFPKDYALSNVNDNGGLIRSDKKYMARIRYRQPLQDCTIKKLPNGQIKVIFRNKQEAPASGQSVVIYDKELCLGGGVIV
jgi:tRNA-specific 2-thiouridylase